MAKHFSWAHSNPPSTLNFLTWIFNHLPFTYLLFFFFTFPFQYISLIFYYHIQKDVNCITCHMIYLFTHLSSSLALFQICAKEIQNQFLPCIFLLFLSPFCLPTIILNQIQTSHCSKKKFNSARFYLTLHDYEEKTKVFKTGLQKTFFK